MSIRSILFLSGFLVIFSYILTYYIRMIALSHRIIDVPNERSIHSIPIPRGGGLAIVISWFIGITVLFVFRIIENRLFFALMSGILISIISFIDDIYNIKPVWRIIVQVIAAATALIFLGGIKSLYISSIELKSGLLFFPVVIVGIVWFINLFNFLDGIDGYASMEAIFVTSAMLFFTKNLVSMILVASVSGFLIWNWPKAKIFMGDVGSTQLGFVLIILGIYFHNSGNLSIFHWIMMTSIFWFDATLTLYRRWKNSEKLSEAHKKHVYQRAVQSGLKHITVIFYGLGLNFVLFISVYSSIIFPYMFLPLFIFDLLILYLVTRIVDKRFPFRFNKVS